MRPWRRLLLPGLVALPVLLVLLGLGTWQLRRLAWKTELLARIDAAEAAPPVPLGAAPPAPYAKLVVAGRFRHDREALLGIEMRGGAMGARLLTPLERGGGRPALLVDRGWVPIAQRGGGGLLQDDGRIARPEGEVPVVGYVRPPQPRGWVSATDDPARRRFFTFDPAAIGAALGLGAVEPFGLVALAGADGAAGALPAPATATPRPTNPHLGYAVTWYGLAFALVAVFVAWARRHRPKEDPAA
jgi:surfeit locus 1 family protein